MRPVSVKYESTQHFISEDIVKNGNRKYYLLQDFFLLKIAMYVL